MNPIYINIIVVLLLIFGYGFIKKQRKMKNREVLKSLPFPPQWIKILNKKFPLYNCLSVSLKEQLHTHIKIFVGEKYFAGFQGIKVDDTMRVLIAAQACLLLLNRKTNMYPYLHVIKIYPQAFINKGGSVNGLRKVARIGESWLRGAVVLSWKDVVNGAKFDEDGTNVVFHEFAHQLDQETGGANGLPLLKNNDIKTWGKIFTKEYKKLKDQTKKDQRSFFDKYGATNPAEFFAVATESFFEEPDKFKTKHPELYNELCKYYCLDPSTWCE